MHSIEPLVSKRSRVTPTMRLEVKRVGCSTPHQLVLSIDTSVRQLKEQLPETLTLGTAPNVFHLIYGGTVLCDDSRLGELALVDQPTLWLLRGLEASSQIRKAAELAVSLGVFLSCCILLISLLYLHLLNLCDDE